MDRNPLDPRNSLFYQLLVPHAELEQVSKLPLRKQLQFWGLVIVLSAVVIGLMIWLRPPNL